MSRDLGLDVPDLENFMQENFGLIFRSLLKESKVSEKDQGATGIGAIRLRGSERFWGL